MCLVDNAVGFMTGPVAHPAKGDAMMDATTSAEIADLIARVTLLPPAPEAVSSIHLWIELSERPSHSGFLQAEGRYGSLDLGAVLVCVDTNRLHVGLPVQCLDPLQYLRSV
jgi:hypothetical protein